MALADITWKIEVHSGIPVYRQIMHHVEAAIAAGRLRTGDQLPTIRALHQQLGVNPNTVAKAYRELALRGILTTEHGTGCYVSPAPVPPRLSAEERRTRVDELAARVAAEARGLGIPLPHLVQQLNRHHRHA